MNADSGARVDRAASTMRGGTIESLKANCDEIAGVSPDNVEQIASILQKMIVSYYQDVRRQALLAFFAAFVLEIVAVAFFFYAASIVMGGDDKKAILIAISGLLIQIMTGVVFYLYSQSSRQFAGFHICLERTNRFLLVNSMVERLPEAERILGRREVITTVLNAPMLTMAILEGGK